MRTRERLIEVLATCNAAYIQGGSAMQVVGLCLGQGDDAGAIEFGAGLAKLMTEHQSPHYRELAAEALHYFTQPGETS
jgi:hypothetical protein